ncbi:MAG TPA: SulP family inorganic anion transporter [Aggregatilineales bacterium]|nr:SulP family inorganic anion transporter [Aggregatilineales bacterium]
MTEAVPLLQSRFWTALTVELRPAAVLKSLTAGILIYILEIVIVLSFAALIFSGNLSDQLPYGLGFILVGNAVLGAIVALISSYPGAIAIGQDIPSAVLAVVAASVVATIGASGHPEQQFPTIVMMIVGTSLATGLFLLSLGVFRLGDLVRFLPYPVMGGFLAGTGWLLTVGGVGVMVNAPVNLDLLQSNFLLRWMPGLALGALMLYAANRYKGPLVVPGLFAGAIGVFYAIVALMHTPLTRLTADGWLLGPFPSGSLWQFPLSSTILSQVNWQVLLGQIPNLAPILIVTVIALLLNANGLELIVRRDIRLNHELVAAGLANTIAGMLGGTVGYHGISLSSLNHIMSGGRRLPGLVAALLLGLTLLFGSAILVYIPKMMLGALLVFLGLSLLLEWVYRAWFKFPRIDFAIIVLILGVITVRGFLEGIAIGVLMTVLMFVVNYSRISVVKHELSGVTYHSRVNRSPRQQRVLEAYGEQLYILKLQGFIFFGTANRLFEKVQARTRVANQQSVRFVLLDFEQVTGLDSTGLLSFSRMLQLAQELHFTLVMTGLHGRALDQFGRGGFHETADLRFFPDLDHGVEMCEDAIIGSLHREQETYRGLQEQLEAIVPMPRQIEQLIHHMDRREIAPGEYLIRQDAETDSLFFVESGQVTAQLETPDQEPMRLETVQGGRTVGEIGFYLGIKRTAAVIANDASVIFSLSQEAMKHIEDTDSEAASVFHRIIIHILGERVIHLTRALDALQN